VSNHDTNEVLARRSANRRRRQFVGRERHKGRVYKRDWPFSALRQCDSEWRQPGREQLKQLDFEANIR